MYIYCLESEGEWCVFCSVKQGKDTAGLSPLPPLKRIRFIYLDLRELFSQDVSVLYKLCEVYLVLNKV